MKDVTKEQIAKAMSLVIVHTIDMFNGRGSIQMLREAYDTCLISIEKEDLINQSCEEFDKVIAGEMDISAVGNLPA